MGQPPSAGGTLQIGNGGTTGTLGNTALLLIPGLSPLIVAYLTSKCYLWRRRRSLVRSEPARPFSPARTPPARLLLAAHADWPGTIGTLAGVLLARFLSGRTNAMTVSNVISGTGTVSQIESEERPVSPARIPTPEQRRSRRHTSAWHRRRLDLFRQAAQRRQRHLCDQPQQYSNAGHRVQRRSYHGTGAFTQLGAGTRY